MNTAVIIPAITAFVLAGVLLVLAVMHFAERGFLLNNAYISNCCSHHKHENHPFRESYPGRAFLFVQILLENGKWQSYNKGCRV